MLQRNINELYKFQTSPKQKYMWFSLLIFVSLQLKFLGYDFAFIIAVVHPPTSGVSKTNGIDLINDIFVYFDAKLIQLINKSIKICNLTLYSFNM